MPSHFPPELHLNESIPPMQGVTLLLALTGWMDGGDVSTGTVTRLMEHRYLTDIVNFPGSMEIASVFRPEVKMKNGLIRRGPKFPKNVFHADPANNLVFFLG